MSICIDHQAMHKEISLIRPESGTHLWVVWCYVYEQNNSSVFTLGAQELPQLQGLKKKKLDRSWFPSAEQAVTPILSSCLLLYLYTTIAPTVITVTQTLKNRCQILSLICGS